MKNNLPEIEKRIKLLNRDELEQLQKKILFLLTTKKRKTSKIDVEAFYTILDNELSKRLKTKSMPFNRFQRTNTFKSLVTAFESTVDYMEVVFKNERLTRASKLHFYLISSKIVLDDCAGSPAPLCMRTLLQSFTILPGLIDRAFPGYVQGGVLPMILKQKYMNKKPLEEINNEKR
jgi:hypothetical protein